MEDRFSGNFLDHTHDFKRCSGLPGFQVTWHFVVCYTSCFCLCFWAPYNCSINSSAPCHCVAHSFNTWILLLLFILYSQIELYLIWGRDAFCPPLVAVNLFSLIAYYVCCSFFHLLHLFLGTVKKVMKISVAPFRIIKMLYWSLELPRCSFFLTLHSSQV